MARKPTRSDTRSIWSQEHIDRSRAQMQNATPQQREAVRGLIPGAGRTGDVLRAGGNALRDLNGAIENMFRSRQRRTKRTLPGK